LDKKDQKNQEHNVSSNNKSDNKTIHLDHAPDPRGRDGQQFDSDLEDLT
jgi:hypothetical protein